MGAAAQEVARGVATLHPARLVTFSSDYGPTDEYVGVCHLVIARIAPEVRVVDIVHGLRGIRAGAVILEQSVAHAPDGSVHLAIVDPGVGTDRRPIVVESARGDLLVGPDNGLLVLGAEALGGAIAAFELTDRRYRNDDVSATFHGRDVFAPAAAYLARGIRPSEFGDAIDAASLVRISIDESIVTDGRLEAEVVRIDWYGNLQLAATEADLAEAKLGQRVVVASAAGEVEAITGRTFGDADPSELVVYVDSGGHVAIAANGSSARDLLQDPERVTVKRKR